MYNQRLMLVFLFVALLALGSWAPSSKAEVVKELRIESIPTGADIYLKQSTKEVHLGKTPLSYTAEFHSEISILRMLFRKSGYQELLLDVSAKQNVVTAKLETRSITASPIDQKDPKLRAIQQRLNPILNKEIPALLEAKGLFDFDLASPIHVVRMDEKVFVVVPLALGNSKYKMKETGKARQEELLKAMWNQCGGALSISLSRILKGQAGIEGIVLDVAFNEQRYLFGVESRIETKLEMKCVPGNRMQQEYDSCAQRDSSSRCQPGYVTRAVYDPCISKIPVSKSELKVDPRAGVMMDKARARYIVPLALVGKGATAENLYNKIDIVLTDAKGVNLMAPDKSAASTKAEDFPFPCAGDSTGLIKASLNKNTEKVISLLNNGITPDQRDLNCYTPLIWSASTGNYEIVKLLLDKGADINAYNRDKHTALTFTVLTIALGMGDDRHVETIKLLIKNGANINFKSMDGTALEIAEKHRLDNIVDLIKRPVPN